MSSCADEMRSRFQEKKHGGPQTKAKFTCKLSVISSYSGCDTLNQQLRKHGEHFLEMHTYVLGEEISK